MRFACRTPFDWARFLDFHAARATPGVELVRGGRYRRTILVDGLPAMLDAGLADRPGYLELKFAGAAPRRASARALACRLFDIDAPVDEIGAALGRDPTLRNMLRRNPGVRVPGTPDPFELTIRAVLGQQISVRAATTLAGRIAARYGESAGIGEIEPGDPDRLFPTPARLARAGFSGLGIVGSRVETIRRVATATMRGDLCFDADADAVVRQLVSIRGIGDWTAQYVAMRALKAPDAFPASDLGLLRALAEPGRLTPRELQRRAEDWRPWRAYAAMLLWGAQPGGGG